MIVSRKWQWRLVALAILVFIVGGSIFVVRWNNRDRLEGVEIECWDQLLTSPAMADAGDFIVVKHYNWWERTYSGSMFAGGELYKPYQDPRVEMLIEFKRQDGMRHRAWIECRFLKVPNSGNPPQIQFEQVRLDWENHLVNGTSWEPWYPPK